MEYTPSDLRAMDESEARAMLTVDQFERWEQLNELLDEAADAEDQLEANAETVAEVTVHADPEALGTTITVFGNDLLVRIRPEDRTFRDRAETVESLAHKYDDRDIDDIDDADIERMVDGLTAMLDHALVRINGTDWDDVAEAERERTLATMREKWGLSGLLTAWQEIMAAVEADREATTEAVESFREA